MSRITNIIHLQNHSLATFSAAQLQTSALESSFSHEACNWRSLTGMMAGSLAFRIGRLAALESFSNLGLMRHVFVAPAFRALAFTSALAGEVTAFRGANQFLAPTVTSPEQSFLNPQGWMATFVDFLSLKTFAPLGAGNVFFGHVSQNLGMMAGHYATSSLGFTPQAQGSLAEQFFHASAMNLQMGVGLLLSNIATGGCFRIIEKSLDFKNLHHDFVNHPEIFHPLPSRMSSEDIEIERSSNVSTKRWVNDGRERLKNFRRSLSTSGNNRTAARTEDWKIPVEVLGVNIENPEVTFREVWLSFKAKHKIRLQTFCDQLSSEGITISLSTINNYEVKPGMAIDPRFLRGIASVYGEDYLDLVYLAGRHLLEGPESRALAVTRDGPLLVHQKWVAGHVNRLAGLGRKSNSLQFKILAALANPENPKSIEELAEGLEISKNQLGKYLSGENQPEPAGIPALAKVLGLSAEGVIEGINEDRGLIPMIDALQMNRGIYFYNNGQANDDQMLRDFSQRGVREIHEDVALYSRYLLWRLHKEMGGGLISTFQRSASWGKDDTFIGHRISGVVPFRLGCLGDWMHVFRRLGQDPAAIYRAYTEQLGIKEGSFSWALHFALEEKSFAEFAQEAGISYQQLIIFCKDPEAFRCMNYLTVARLLLALEPIYRPIVLRTMAVDSLRRVFPEMFFENDPRMVIEISDIEAACRFALPQALNKILNSKNIIVRELSEVVSVPVETLRGYVRGKAKVPMLNRMSSLCAVSGLSEKAWLIHFYPELLLVLPLENAQTASKFRIHASRVRPLFAAIGRPTSFDRAAAVREISEETRLSELRLKVGAWNARTEVNLARDEEEDLYFIWRYSENLKHQTRAEEILLTSYRYYVEKLTRSILSRLGLNWSQHLPTALSEAHLGFRRALEGFNSDFGYRFMTYIMNERNWIRQKVERWCYAQIKQQNLERFSLDQNIGDDEGESFLDRKADHNISPERRDLRADPSLNVAMNSINNWLGAQRRPEFWRAVFVGRFLGDQTLEEIGLSHNVSKERVRQIEAKIRAEAQRVFSEFQDSD